MVNRNAPASAPFKNNFMIYKLDIPGPVIDVLRFSMTPVTGDKYGRLDRNGIGCKKKHFNIAWIFSKINNFFIGPGMKIGDGMEQNGTHEHIKKYSI
jgi:hypothetical protein